MDARVRELWSKLSSRDETFDALQSNNVQLGLSVSKLANDLNQSVAQNNTFNDHVAVAKKLFL